MSTKKIRDGISKQPISTSSKTKTTREKSNDRKTGKKEEKTVTKTRTSSRTRKKNEEDEKIKKPMLKSQNSVRKVSRPPLVAGTPKTTSRSKSERPVTPPSSRVTKTQYFPSKKLYANALKSEDLERIKAASKLTTSVVKKKPKPEIKHVQEINDASSDTSSMSERPRTATLRKGSIVNNNIVGPEVPKKPKIPINIRKTIEESVKVPKKLKLTVQNTTEDPIEVPNKKPKESIKSQAEEPAEDYEDDFESYESDFEEYNSSSSTTTITSTYTSTETSESESTEQQTPPKRISSAGTDDEKKLDSGNYELPEYRHKQILDNIKESIEKENTNLTQDHRSNLGSLSDEGFEDAKSLQFINFLGAQKKYKHRKSMELRRRRGEEILGMIRLDHYSFTLLDLAPVPYDVFIKTFGKSNTVQISVQTGEDDVNEEIQTEEITCTNKWTQFPPNFTKMDQITNDDTFWGHYKCNYLGVGGDETQEQKFENTNENILERFLLSAGNLILNIQAEENIQISENSQTKSNIPFSKGYILYNSQTHELLQKRPINDVCFCSNNLNKILTVHGKGDFSQSLVCLWNMSNTKEPEMSLMSYGEVTCCSFGFDSSHLIFGGSNDGTIAVWDIKESLTNHKTMDHEELGNFSVRTPTYCTEINQGHGCKIVSILSLSNSSSGTNLFAEQKSAEICSLDEDGVIIIWSVIFKEPSRGKISENQGLAHWGAVIITINTKISLRKLYPEIDEFKSTDLALSHSDSSHLFISTNYGIIIHCLSNGGRTSVKKFLPGTHSQANCLEMCPFSPHYIIAGFDNGDINFYSRTIERPLMVLSNKDRVEGECQIQKIQWSYNRPLMFYTQDITNTIHVWNLKVSDMLPVYSVPFKEKIMCMKLSPTIKMNDIPEKTYMIIATEKGSIYVHLLSDDHGQQSLQDFEEDKRKFFNYISRYV